MKPNERKLAESLRHQGATYREILRQVPVSKSTLSLWLRHILLTELQMARIHGKNLEIRRRFVEYSRRKHEAAMAQHEAWREAAKVEAIPVTGELLKWIGVGLYWAEGTKRVSIR